MSTKRVIEGDRVSTVIPPLIVRRSKRGKIESVASESLEESTPGIKNAKSLKDRLVTFAPTVKTISSEEIRQIHAAIRHAIDCGMPELIEATGQIPSNCTPAMLNADFHEPIFPISYALKKLRDQPIPIGIFAALFEAGYRPTNLHLFALWDTLDAKHETPNARDLSSEKQALTGLFLAKMHKDEIGKVVQIFWKTIFEIQKRQLSKNHPATQNTVNSFEFLMRSISKGGCENFGENLVRGFKEIAPSNLKQISKIHDFDQILLDILFNNLTVSLENGTSVFGICILVDIVCIINTANPLHSSNLGQALLLKYLKTPVNLEVLTHLLRLPIPWDHQFVSKAVNGCSPAVQALLKEKGVVTG